MDPGSVAALGVLADFLSKLIVIPVFLIAFGVPAWVILRVARLRAGERMNKEDAASMVAMGERLRRMDERMAALEHLLDAEVPEWRHNLDGTGGEYARQAG